jgi:hypothetical protein
MNSSASATTIFAEDVAFLREHTRMIAPQLRMLAAHGLP